MASEDIPLKKNIFGTVMTCLAASAVLGCGPVCGSQAYSGRSIVLSGGRLIDGNGGAPIAVGTDFEPGLETGMPSTEMLLMRQCGMTPMQIIVAATKHGAHVCGLDSELGTIESGKIADILVVDGDPLTDLNVLKNNRLLVLHNGRVAFSRLTSGCFYHARRIQRQRKT